MLMEEVREQVCRDLGEGILGREWQVQRFCGGQGQLALWAHVTCVVTWGPRLRSTLCLV